MRPVVRYHHSTDAEIENACIEQKLKWVAKCLRIVDATDLFFVNNGRKDMDKANAYFLESITQIIPCRIAAGECRAFHNA